MTAMPAHVLATLIDSRTGIVRSVERRPIPQRMPSSFALVASRLSDTTQYAPWAADSAGAGYAFDDEDSALAAAVGEAVERYCGNLIPDRLVTSCWDELTAAGTAALDPDTLALFTAAQYATSGFPCVRLSRSLQVEWTQGRDMSSGSTVAVPASLVWASYAYSTRGPRTNPILQAGLATGPTRAAAEESALLEIVERDAMALSWNGRAGLHQVLPDPALARLAEGPQRQLHTRFYSFHSPFGIPVIGALVYDRSTGYLALGAGARPDPRQAAVKALGEALQLSLLLGEYDDPHGAFAAAAQAAQSPLRPWRADRHYAASYRRDLSDVMDYGCHLQLALDPAVQQRIENELRASISGPPGALADLPPGDMDTLMCSLQDTGHAPAAVDVTTPDVRAAGLHVTRVLVPGLLCNSAAGLPLLGSQRLQTALAGRPYRVLPLPH